MCVYDCVEGIRRREEGEREVQRHVRQCVCVCVCMVYVGRMWEKKEDQTTQSKSKTTKGKKDSYRLTNRQTIRQTRQMQSKIKKRAHTETTIFT